MKEHSKFNHVNLKHFGIEQFISISTFQDTFGIKSEGKFFGDTNNKIYRKTEEKGPQFPRKKGFSQAKFPSLTLTNKVEKCSCYWVVCLSVSARSNIRKYSSSVLKLICIIYIPCSMDHIENGIYTTVGSSTKTYKIFPKHYGL